MWELLSTRASGSVNYFLEVDTAEGQFKNPIILAFNSQNKALKFSVSQLNGLLIKHYPADTASQLEFRIRSVLVQDAGTGYTPIVIISPSLQASVTIYGLPRLELIGSGISQKIESASDDGNYTGYVKLDPADPFTLTDPDSGISYGLTGGVLAANGSGGITAPSAGWYLLAIDINNLTYNLAPNMIGVIGDFNGWASLIRRWIITHREATGILLLI